MRLILTNLPTTNESTARAGGVAVARDRNRSRDLRRVAEHLASEIPEEALTATRAEIATSLLRQWLTYDNHATLFVDTEQHYLTPDIGVGGKIGFGFFKVDAAGWYKELMQDWDFGEEELGVAIRQLNVAQSAQIENRRGEFLRLWANPKERTKGLERLGGPPRAQPPSETPDFVKLAGRAITAVLSDKLPPADRDELVAAVVRQWAAHDNHALIVTGAKKHHVILEPLPDRLCRLTIRPLKSDLGERLLACGVPPDDLHLVLHRINLGERPVFADEWGQLGQVTIDPKTAGVSMMVVFLTPPG